MSWQLISLVVLFTALGAGMLWYERTRPPSQIVALVAVLAALAVAGRLVLAPIPNVVATTDIVIIAGFVLGPAPGFAVGALGGLVSNFWLGQGIWTPWQMVAWGMCGVAGGLLWKMTRGRLNRWWLAAFCGAAGLAFGAWMNLQTMVSFGGEISLDRYLALEVRAIPFDTAHMIGNVIFALAAGPAMVSALLRFKERFQWRKAGETSGSQSGSPLMRTSGIGLLLVAALAISFGGAGQPGKAEAAYPAKAGNAAAWLQSQQNADGGFPSSPEGTSSVNITARSMFALAAAGINPLDVKTNATPYGYLINNRKEITDASDIALTILAVKTVGQNPRDFKGRNLIEALRNHRGNGSFGNNVNITAFSILAFRSAGSTKDARYSLKWLNGAQNTDGGWGISKGSKSDADSSGTALMAITSDKSASKAINYLRGIQKNSGGFVSGSTVNSQSTGLVIQGLIAQGKGMNYLRSNGKSAGDFLISNQQDDGSIWYSKSSDQTRVWVTADGTTALAGLPLPVAAPPRAKDGSTSDDNSGGAAPSDPGGTSAPTYTPPPGSLASPSTGTESTGGGNTGSVPGTGAGAGTGNQNDFGADSGSDADASIPPATEFPADTSIPLVPVAPSDAVLAASEAGPQPSPLVAILIALGVAGGLCGGTILLVRRLRW
ncbi:MAG TPA: prenyltransferase/squalene oxidase repeat-containing protein [Solirubrobacterales bacterium]|nr:prenyltransferase/squalene oxidase repeat-containing protein [Solirubrobacterales bacterium]